MSKKRLFLLQDRASLLHKSRDFFSKKQILEVDCPSITKYPSIDLHIELMTTSPLSKEIAFLHSSPEYCMKRLLAEGIGDIYQLGHVFRKDELGHLHNPEFTLVEWYRKNIDFSLFIQEVLEYFFLFLEKLPSKTLTYQQAFIHYTRLDPFRSSKEELIAYIKGKGQTVDSSFDHDVLLQWILSHWVEPNLGKKEFLILTDFPPSQAALAKIEFNGDFFVARRFEIYHKGIELANGYLELTDAKEQKKRFEELNKFRKKNKQKSLAVDKDFLKALAKLKDGWCGVAVGFDRLMMLRHKQKSIHKILPFSWQKKK